MMLHAPAHMLSKLYDGNPKVLVLADGLIPFGRAQTHLDHYLFAQGQDGRFLLQGANDEAGLHALELPPTNVWAIWVPAPVSASMLEQMKDWCIGRGGERFDAVIVEGGHDELVQALLGRSLQETRRLANSNVALMRDVAAMRESWESHVRIPAEIEQLLQNLRLSSPRLIFDNGETPGQRTLPVGPSERAGIVQRLPIGARGLLGFDLRLTGVSDPRGSLFARLVARDTGAVLAEGRTASHNLSAGWLPFRLQRAMSISAHATDLHIWTDSDSGGPVAELAIVRTGLLSEFRVAQDGADARDPEVPHMLALRLWGGLPGVDILSAEGEFGNGPLAAFTMSVPDSVVQSVALTRELSAPYPVFGYMEHGKVLLRPLKSIPSAAVLRLPPTRGLVEVSCEIFIDDKRCETPGLGARIVVTRRGATVEEAENAEGALAATDWVELNEPLKTSKLIARLPDIWNEPVDVHLFSRLPKPGPVPPYGRVVFKGFETQVHAGSAWERSPVMLQASAPA